MLTSRSVPFSIADWRVVTANFLIGDWRRASDVRESRAKNSTKFGMDFRMSNRGYYFPDDSPSLLPPLI
jgi:hypothetical protein